jgi:hypothetical protein
MPTDVIEVFLKRILDVCEQTRSMGPEKEAGAVQKHKKKRPPAKKKRKSKTQPGVGLYERNAPLPDPDEWTRQRREEVARGRSERKAELAVLNRRPFTFEDADVLRASQNPSYKNRSIRCQMLLNQISEALDELRGLI